jgi:site-specific recombinase XerD
MPIRQNLSRNSQNTCEISIKPELLDEFAEFMKVNMRLERRTVRESKSNIRRFLENANYVVSYQNISQYLKTYMGKSHRTYNGQLTSLRRFIRDFLHAPASILDFKLAPIDLIGKNIPMPSKEQLKKGFDALIDDGEKALFLFTATTGLRRSEIMCLTKDKIDFKLRSVIPQHFTRVKRSGITFFSSETEFWLNKYLTSRKTENIRVFPLNDERCKRLWKRASLAAGIRITPQVLRVWFATELGENLIPDRFIDLFQGRAPRSVLAKNYTSRGLARLKTIYERANLCILSNTEPAQKQNIDSELTDYSKLNLPRVVELEIEAALE